MNSPQGEGSNTPGADAADERTTDRPAGTVDEDANVPLTDAGEPTPDAGADNLPPQDTGQAIPPYEGRQGSTKD